MKPFSFYDERTGVLSANSFVIHAPDADELAQLNCPPGHKPIEGVFDPLSQRVDVEHPRHVDYEDAEGNAAQRIEFDVIGYQPPQPSSEHCWNADTKRWRLSAEAQAKSQVRQAAQDRIAALVASQHAVVRDMLLGSLAARPRLQAIADEIAGLESRL